MKIQQEKFQSCSDYKLSWCIARFAKSKSTSEDESPSSCSNWKTWALLFHPRSKAVVTPLSNKHLPEVFGNQLLCLKRYPLQIKNREKISCDGVTICFISSWAFHCAWDLMQQCSQSKQDEACQATGSNRPLSTDRPGVTKGPSAAEKKAMCYFKVT